MPVVVRLTDEEVQAIAEAVLREQLREDGFDHAFVRSGQDHDGEEALFITAVLKEHTGSLSGDSQSRAHEALDNSLRAKGEQRFPYFSLKRIGDWPIDDNELARVS